MSRILLAEDDTFLQKMLVVSLEEAGHTVQAVTNGADALDAIKKQAPDILLLDILMPKLDGFGVLEQLQKDGATFPIIMLSNLGQDDDAERCKKLGAKAYFVKSDMEPGDLVEAIKKYL